LDELRQRVGPLAGFFKHEAETHAQQRVLRIDLDRLLVQSCGLGAVFHAESLFGLAQKVVDRAAVPLMPERDLHRTVDPILLQRLLDYALDELLRVVDPVVWLVVVWESLDVVDVERNRLVGQAKQRRARRAQRMPHAELVEHVCVQAGDVGNGDARILQVLEHVLRDVAGEEIAVGAMRRQRSSLGEPGGRDGREEHLVVDPVEIDHPCADRLPAERHDHETGLDVVDHVQRFLARSPA
jgi:hypothetical protein